MHLTGKRALITGASSGIGKSLAIEFATNGCSLALVARRRDPLVHVAEEIGRSTGRPPPAVIVADLADRGAAAEVAVRAEEALGRVDILVNNAGMSVHGYQAAAGDRDEARDTFEVNVWSPVALAAALVPAMRRRREGAVVNVTSFMQIMAWPTLGYYTATKAALGALTEALRLELAESGIHVMEVIPGAVETPMQGESMLVPGLAAGMRATRPGKPEVLARAIVRGIEREQERIIYPRPLRFLYVHPRFVRRFATRQVKRVRHEFDPTDIRVLRSGSQGDEVARMAREAWERGERDPAKLQALFDNHPRPVPTRRGRRYRRSDKAAN